MRANNALRSVYAIEVDYDNYKSFLPKNMDISIRCKGQPLGWTDVVEITVDEEDIGMPEADVSLLNVGSFVMLATTFDETLSDFKSNFELLPLTLDGREYYLCNVVNVVDCLNRDRSKMNEFVGVSHVVFESSKVPDQGFFKIREDNCTLIFCTENVRKLFERHSLSGVDFDEFEVV